MRTIWKYPLELKVEGMNAMWGVTQITLPKDSTVLCVQLQGMAPFLWILTGNMGDVDDQKEWRVFEIYGTGQQLPDADLKYVGTFQREWFVGHVFERVSR
jgi:hypothetical protein